MGHGRAGQQRASWGCGGSESSKPITTTGLLLTGAYGCLDTGAKGHRGRVVGEEERGKIIMILKKNGSMHLTGAYGRIDRSAGDVGGAVFSW